MRNIDIPTLEEGNVRTMSTWDVAEIAHTALRSYGYECPLEIGGNGEPEMFVALMFGGTPAILHYANYAYEGFSVEKYAGEGFGWEESPEFARFEIDRERPIGRQVMNYLQTLQHGKAVN